MPVLFFGLALIGFSNFYNWFLKIFKLKSTLQSAVIYALSGILIASIGAWLNAETASVGAIFVFFFCIFGAIVRIGVTYFRNKELPVINSK